MLVQQVPLVDPSTRLPIAVIDTTRLNGSLPNQHTVLKGIKALPDTDFCLVLFASHSPKFNLAWAQATNKLVPYEARKRLKKLYIVHETWLYKTLQKTIGSMLSPKFRKKVVYVKNLTELAQHIDITLLNIARDIYLHDLELSQTLVVPKYSQLVYGYPLSAGHDFIDQLLEFLYVAPLTPKSFDNTGGNPLVWVLMQAFDRNQTLDLTDYGPQLVIAAFKLYLFELPEPLLPLESIHLPIQETQTYLEKLVAESPHRIILTKLCDWFAHARSVYHIESDVIARSFGLAMCRLLQPTKDEEMISVRTARLFARFTLKPLLLPSQSLESLSETPIELLSEIPEVETEVEPETPSNTLSGIPLQEKSRNTYNPRATNRPALKAAGPKPAKPARVLRTKPSMGNIRGLRVGEMALKFENI